jgi:hypothetical protein
MAGYSWMDRQCSDDADERVVSPAVEVEAAASERMASTCSNAMFNIFSCIDFDQGWPIGRAKGATAPDPKREGPHLQIIIVNTIHYT